MESQRIALDGETLDISGLISIVRKEAVPFIPDTAREKMSFSRRIVEDLVASGETVYGITTGFGKFADVVISPAETQVLQRNLIMSHACGVGEPFSPEIVRAMMVLRVNAMAKGFSGVRIEVAQMLLDMLAADVIPVVPSQGSVGASGDLAPLAHMVLVMLGLGEALLAGVRMTGAEALAAAGISPVVLQAKEGLALINGTQAMTACACLALERAETIAAAADIAGAMSFEALEGLSAAYDPRVHAARAHDGQTLVASNMRLLLGNSEILARKMHDRVQDAYSLRCIPQVHGASRDAIAYVRKVLEREINSATDNPLVFHEGDVISGGNFHGQPVALAADFLGIALAELANISERRVERLVNPFLSGGLPAFLIRAGGLNSGFMIAQYVCASLVSENKVLSHPACVDSIPTSAGQEDHVSMGTISARKALSIADNAARVLAIELLASAQALDLHAPLASSPPLAAVRSLIRQDIPYLEVDRVMYPDIDKAYRLLVSGAVVQAARENCDGFE